MLIPCPSCQRQLNVPDNAVGKQVRCPAPDCGTVFYVPAAAAPMPAAPAPRPAAPAKPAVKPGPTAPAPASSSPFDFGGGGSVAGPEADFGFTEHTDGGLRGIGLRTRISRASGWLNMAAGSMVLYAVFLLSIGVTMTVMSRNWVGLAGAICVPMVLLPFPVITVLGARMLSRSRRYGIAMTAAIICLVVGALALIVTLVIGGWSMFLVYAAVSHGMASAGQFVVISACGDAVLSAVVAFAGLYGGFIALRTLMNAEVKAAFT